MPEPITLALSLGATALKAGAAKGAAAGAAKAGAAHAGLAKASEGAAHATIHATTYATTYGPGAIGATATEAILGTCVATSTMLAIAACLVGVVDAHHMLESSAREHCEKINNKGLDEQEAILKDLEQTPPDEATQVLERHRV